MECITGVPRHYITALFLAVQVSFLITEKLTGAGVALTFDWWVEKAYYKRTTLVLVLGGLV